jgi:hypothetical protein
VLDLYWHFAEPGDTFLGRVLAGLDPNGEEFATLPPHWIMDDPLSNDRIKEAMNLMFATILQRWGGTEVDPTGILLYFLASVVWHSDWLKEMAAKHPGHPFSMIPILSTPELLRDLKELVTLEPKGNVKSATGIPPHIQNASVAKKILSLCEATLEAVKGMIETVKTSVKDAFEEKAAENGQVTGERLKQMLDEHQESIVQLIDNKLTELRNEMRDCFPAAPEQQDGGSDDGAMQFAEGEAEDVSVRDTNTQQEVQVTYRNYSHGGNFWNVPKDFTFPTGVRLDTGWKIWLCGLPGNETVDNNGNRQQAPIRPFRKLKDDMLPDEIKKNLRLHWRPIFSMMEAAPGIKIRETGIDSDYLHTSFHAAREYLKTRVRYAFENENWHPERWGISTWSRKVQRSSILKHGTEQDKANLPPESNHNKSRRQHGRAKPQADRRRVRQRTDRTSGRARRRDYDDEVGELPDLRDRLTPAAIARDQQIQAEVAAEEVRAQLQQLEEARRANRFGIAQADGTTVHVGPRFPLQDSHR